MASLFALSISSRLSRSVVSCFSTRFTEIFPPIGRPLRFSTLSDLSETSTKLNDVPQSPQEHWFSQKHLHSTEDDREGVHTNPTPRINVQLEAIKAAGLTQLSYQTQDLISRSRQKLFFDEENIDPITGKPKRTIAQIQEAARLETAVTEAFVHYSSKLTTFSIRGHCINILGVEVSTDLRTAEVFWCLPLSLDLEKLPHNILEKLVKGMQKLLDKRGGKIQGLVHTRLRSYYPPKLRFVPGEHVSKDLKRRVSI